MKFYDSLLFLYLFLGKQSTSFLQLQHGAFCVIIKFKIIG